MSGANDNSINPLLSFLLPSKDIFVFYFSHYSSFVLAHNVTTALASPMTLSD